MWLSLPSPSTQSPYPPMKSALARMTPSAPPSGISSSASIAYERPATRGDEALLHVLDVARERVAGDRGQRRQDAEEDADRAEQRQRPVALRLLPEQLLQLLELLGVLRREVLRLREVVRQVVQLPHVLLGVPLARGERGERRRREVPRGLVEARARPPAVLVHRPRADHLEVLLRVPLLGGRVVERVEEARAVHRLLLDPVDRLRLRDPGRLEDGRADVDAVRELRAQVAARLDLAGPRDDHRVARPAQVARHLLAPLERGVAGPRPGGGDVGSGVVAAPPLDAAVLARSARAAASGSSTTPFRNVISLNEPVVVPSRLAPLSPQM